MAVPQVAEIDAGKKQNARRNATAGEQALIMHRTALVATQAEKDAPARAARQAQHAALVALAPSLRADPEQAADDATSAGQFLASLAAGTAPSDAQIASAIRFLLCCQLAANGI